MHEIGSHTVFMHVYDECRLMHDTLAEKRRDFAFAVLLQSILDCLCVTYMQLGAMCVSLRGLFVDTRAHARVVCLFYLARCTNDPPEDPPPSCVCKCVCARITPAVSSHPSRPLMTELHSESL